jgi:hypothetical protein
MYYESVVRKKKLKAEWMSEEMGGGEEGER